MVQVSLSTTTSFDGDLNALVEDQGTALTVRFDLDEPAPAGGLKVYVDSNVEQIVNRLNLLSFASNPTVENINPNLLGTNFDNSGFFLTIDEGATTASFTINVFDNPEPDTFLPATFDGLVEATFSLTTEVEPQDLADVGTLGDYTIAPDATSSTVLFADDASQLTDTPEPPTEPPTEPPASGLPLASLHTGPDFLVEEEGTVSAHVFNVTNATIPDGGLLVSVSAPGLSEFDLGSINVSEGGEVVEVREDGFDIRLTDFTVLVDLPIADDGEAEGLETTRFSLQAGAGYEVNADIRSGEFTLVDTADELPVNTSNRNDIIPLATDIELSVDNPEVTISEEIGFSIGNRYQNADGSFTYVDAAEDVDFYKIDLVAGDIISIDTESLVKGDPSVAEFSGFDFTNSITDILRIFDAEGNELAADQQSQAPGEVFTSGFDGYLEFEAPADGAYYLGVSTFTNGAAQRFALPEFYGELTYDPFIPASGDGNVFGVSAPNFGEYELNIALNPENLVYLVEQRGQSNNTPPETIDLAQADEPTVSLNFSTATFAAAENPRVISGELNEDDVINGNVIEGFPVIGSALNLVFTTEGDIPEEGILVNVNSEGYLRDYFTNRTLLQPPFTPGSQLVDVITDETGRETGFQVRIFEPATFITLSARTPYWAELLAPGADGLALQPETDGPEDVTFFLEGGEGYGVSETANQVTPTFYDSEEQAPEPSVIPEVSLTISETELIESEGTETTLNFSLSEAPPEEGVLVYVKGAAGILPQFDVLNGEATGGVYPTANGNVSGFYFKITEPEASLTLTVFEDPFTEGLQSFNLALQETPLYTIDPNASEVNFTIADNPDSVLEVSLRSDSVAVESDNVAGLLTFNLTANPPTDGIEVTVNADNLSDFDTQAFTITGGELTEITETGFSLNITDATATVELPLVLDGEAESLETSVFELVESVDYLIDPDAPQAAVTLVDTPEQIPPPTEEFASNDTIAEALALNLNTFNTTATVTAALESREPNDFSEPAFGVNEISEATEDVDFYSFDLAAGDTVKLDIDAIPAEFEARYEGVELKLDSELRLFDAEGNELAHVNNGAAPDEEFSRDPYLEFTAQSAGTYYVGISQLGHNDYDPLDETNEGVGSGWIFPEIGVYFGEYELTATLATGDGQPSIGNLIGTDNADILTGTDGDDLLDGLLGDDTYTGGAGADQFVLGLAQGVDTLTDFEVGVDQIKLGG